MRCLFYLERFEFTPLPLKFYVIFGGMVVNHVILAEMGKRLFYKRLANDMRRSASPQWSLKDAVLAACQIELSASASMPFGVFWYDAYEAW